VANGRPACTLLCWVRLMAKCELPVHKLRKSDGNQGMKLGFIGSGSIASAIVTGLRAAGNTDPIEMSPRNAEVAADLADRFENVQIAPTNQAVLDASDVVVLAVRPQIASIVLPELRFRHDHHVVSLIPTLSLDYLRSVTAPAAVVTRAVPLPSVARRQGPTAIYPPSEPIKAFFDSLGVAIELESESEFDAFTTATAVIASYFTFADVVTGWMTRHGAAAEKAQAFVSKCFEVWPRPRRQAAALRRWPRSTRPEGGSTSRF
jgi:pyrroline-5-carboxylate reductase